MDYRKSAYACFSKDLAYVRNSKRLITSCTRCRLEYEDYVKQIEEIPLNPPPEALGLHMNAGITRDLELANNFFLSMMLVQGTVTVGDTSKQDEMLLNMKTDIYDKMPELFDMEEAQKKYPVVYMESMNTVLIQELERYNTLLHEVRQSLVMLERAVQGLIVMTPGIEVPRTDHNLLNRNEPSDVSISNVTRIERMHCTITGFNRSHTERENPAVLDESVRLSELEAATELRRRFPQSTEFLSEMVGRRETEDFLDIRVLVRARFPHSNHPELCEKVQDTDRQGRL